jgi:hypothetical protein
MQYEPTSMGTTESKAADGIRDRRPTEDGLDVVHYTAMDGRLGWMLVVIFAGGFAGVGLVILSGLWMDRANAVNELGYVGLGWLIFIGAASTLTFGPFAARGLAIGLRSVSGTWWLRLTSEGFEVNDRLFAPRRHAWADIEEFILVNGVTVGFRYAPGRRRPLRKRSQLDATIMGYWDRPFDEAVALMNSWLARYRPSVPKARYVDDIAVWCSDEVPRLS